MSRSFSRYMKEARFALLLLLVLVVITVILTPSRFSPAQFGTTLGLMTPLILAACAVTPVFLAGREGIDLSVGPMIGFISVIIVKLLIHDAGVSSPFVIIPAALLLGMAIGAVNGFLAVYLRVQPIVTTLGTYLVLAGLATWILPSPLGPVPKWLVGLSENYSIIPLLFVAGIWLAIKSRPLYGMILTIGGEDRAAYAAGVNVELVRFTTYVIAGFFAAVAAVALTGLLGSADPQVGPNYTLLAIAAAALGGVSLAGGKGTMVGAAIGAVDVFLLQNLVTHFNVSSFVLQIVYGLILVLAVALNSDVIGRKSFFGRETTDG
ncbi:ABC transporter permease [Hoeflea sp.]|uniref:ABC transporter permease n=1 Tax=Hoeflea sp. TaxID=1940281 RepID=UPI003BAF3B6E